MKFKSQLVTQASGSIGGLTGSHNIGGMYFRARSIPVNGRTAFQQTVRNAVSSLSTRWLSTLTAAQRTGWATFAANVPITDTLGEARNVTALDWYIKANVLRIQASVAVIDAPPGIFELATATLPVPTITAAGTTVSVAFTNTDAWANEAAGYMLCYASRPQNATINSSAGISYRFAGKITGAATPPTTPQVITLPFASGVTGSKQFFRFVAIRADGRPSGPFRTTGTA